MSWLVYAILARFFWACSNVMDQYMARYSGHDSIAGLLILQHIFQPPFIIGLFLYIFQTTGAPPILHLYSMLWLGAGVILSFVALVPYFLALKKDDTHNVIPFYELVPVFLAFFSWLLFGDRLVGLQLLGAALVVGGGFLFAWDFKHGHIRRRTLGLMTLSSLCYTVYQLGIRYSSHNESVWSMAFFISCGFFLGALVILITAPKPRRLFITSIHRSRGKILAVAFAQNLTETTAFICLTLAFAKAPGAGQAGALSGTQPIFVLGISALCGLVLPGHYTRLTWDREMAIKCVLLLVIACGIALLKPS